MAKNDRIRRLVPLFEQGRVYLPEDCYRITHDNKRVDLTREFIDDEYEYFPVSSHDDMLDCLARILDTDLGATFPDTVNSDYRAMRDRYVTQYEIAGL